MVSKTEMDRELVRIQMLLQVSGLPFERDDKYIDASKYGAKSAMGFGLKDPKISLRIYVFEYEHSLELAMMNVEAESISDQTIRKLGRNGLVLLVAEADLRQGTRAQVTLNECLAAFAGEE